MDEKKIVGIRRVSFLNLLEKHLGITDSDTLNKIFDKMKAERKNMSEFITPILVNHLKNNPGIHGDCKNDDLDYLISEFEKIILNLKIKKNKLIKNRG